MASWLISLLVFVVVVIGRGRCNDSDICGCDDPDNIANPQTCERLFRLFEDSLLSDGGNMYKLRKLLYPSIVPTPELANITYHIAFTTTDDVPAPVVVDLRSYRAPLVSQGKRLPDSPGELSACLCNRKILNTSETFAFRYGWTTIGIYTVIHPALLNQFQVQLPFVIMRLVTPDYVPFLWNGHSQLPSTSIRLTISTDNLTCLPGDNEVDGALMTLTSYVSIFNVFLIYYIRDER